MLTFFFRLSTLLDETVSIRSAWQAWTQCYFSFELLSPLFNGCLCGFDCSRRWQIAAPQNTRQFVYVCACICRLRRVQYVDNFSLIGIKFIIQVSLPSVWVFDLHPVISPPKQCLHCVQKNRCHTIHRTWQLTTKLQHCGSFIAEICAQNFCLSCSTSAFFPHCTRNNMFGFFWGMCLF